MMATRSVFSGRFVQITERIVMKYRDGRYDAMAIRIVMTPGSDEKGGNREESTLADSRYYSSRRNINAK